MTLVKVCGLTRPEDVAAVNAARPDWAGLIFVPASRRHVTPEQAASLSAQLDPAIAPVGVFRDAPPETVARLAEAGVIAVAQLHGREDAAYIAALRALTPIPLVKAVSVTGLAAVSAPPAGPDVPADHLLFDNGSGGTGQTFDLNLIRQARQAGTLTLKPFFIAGGVAAATLDAVLALRPDGVDLNSGVETDGAKDPAKIRRLVAAVRAFDAQTSDRPD